LFQCADCHTDITSAPHETKPQKPQCDSCHAEELSAWRHSEHAKGLYEGVGGAQCVSCHGSVHEILPSTDPNSRTYHTNIPKTCGSCHGQKFVMEKAGLSTQMFASYQGSVHGRAVARGSMKAAVCTDCHDFHAVYSPNNPQSAIFKFNVPRTCGKCHASIAVQYSSSVHGKALQHGNWNSPVCTDCHGIHAIKSPVDPTSTVAAGQVAMTTCARCHDGVRLTQEFGVPAGRVSSYRESYHGLARRLGSHVAANCASCHGIHDILPSSDPRAATNHQNLQKTCGKCHKGATAKFAMGRIHLSSGEKIDTQSMAVSTIREVYLLLIFGTIGFMIVHNTIIWLRKTLAHRRRAGRTVTRMSLNIRLQHLALALSFVMLVLTGFALAWPDSIFAMLFGSSEGPRRVIHRISAIVMLALGAYHVCYMLFTREGRQGLRDFWFSFKDARDLFDVLRYNLGLSTKRPRMGRFTYGEKLEYWAVVWGTVVMGVTGLAIWANVATATWIPRWWLDIATTIHFYEALLATLAIIVWHLYAVIFDPDSYPMNWAWFDGKVSEEHEQSSEEADNA
jgi:cytochrome b subunit of formate dehydrogenase